ncbi:hypothetical protein [Variovorax paradoxus]|uniref:hypothetical protein n=1 Tax=Variovorax paradoxus TaxID=34073 RepID=UPI0027D7D2FE|nr:hypothetical protein [Variovorax paradoxus]
MTQLMPGVNYFERLKIIVVRQAELVQLSACGHAEIFDLFDAHAQISYLVLRVLPLGSEFGENAVNPRLAISPATSSWSLPISSGEGELA